MTADVGPGTLHPLYGSMQRMSHCLAQNVSCSRRNPNEVITISSLSSIPKATHLVLKSTLQSLKNWTTYRYGCFLGIDGRFCVSVAFGSHVVRLNLEVFMFLVIEIIPWYLLRHATNTGPPKSPGALILDQEGTIWWIHPNHKNKSDEWR